MVQTQVLADRLTQLVHGRHVPEGVIALDLGGEGRIVVDGRQIPPSVNLGDAPADLTVSLTAATLAGMLDGSVDPQAAFLGGDIKVTGDIGMAMELASLFQE